MIRETLMSDTTIEEIPAVKSRSPIPESTAERHITFLVAGAVLALSAGLVTYGLFTGGEDGSRPESRTPTAAVTYEVLDEGTAGISYQGGSEAGRAVTVDAAQLPWRTTVDVPLGQDPVVSITLVERGGQARCTLAVRGRHVQSATATGGFGRATCAGTLPAARD
jgi:hypothetical protein